jgi:hypothetical protein
MATIPALMAMSSAALADPLGALMAKGNGAACYERIYDDAHLARNPGQKTREMLLSLRAEGGDPDGATLRIRIRQDKRDLYQLGECAFAEKANLDVMDKPLIAAFKGPSGLDCHLYASTDPGSAEEGGDFPIDLRDGATIVVYFPDGLAAWTSLDRPVEADFPEFGVDDRVFKLSRTSNGACRELVQGLPSQF